MADLSIQPAPGPPVADPPIRLWLDPLGPHRHLCGHADRNILNLAPLAVGPTWVVKPTCWAGGNSFNPRASRTSVGHVRVPSVLLEVGCGDMYGCLTRSHALMRESGRSWSISTRRSTTLGHTCRQYGWQCQACNNSNEKRCLHVYIYRFANLII